MKERPILFTGPMVKAIFDNRKTQTRRICDRIVWVGEGAPDHCTYYGKNATIGRCRYGEKGDCLWVRETVKLHPQAWDDMVVEYTAGGHREIGPNSGDVPDEKLTDYFKLLDKAKGVKGGLTLPSIFMRRWMCRLVLELQDVRVEKLCDISVEDALAEGLQCRSHPILRCMTYGLPEWDRYLWRMSPIDFYATLWDSINADQGEGWDSNPWVWVVEFNRAVPAIA